MSEVKVSSKNQYLRPNVADIEMLFCANAHNIRVLGSILRNLKSDSMEKSQKTQGISSVIDVRLYFVVNVILVSYDKTYG